VPTEQGRSSQITVRCRAHHMGEEEPESFDLGGARRRVKAVLDAWLAPDHRYFKVKADDGGVYILRHDVSGGYWELIYYGLPEPRGNEGGLA
jgi:hypothetical protein